MSRSKEVDSILEEYVGMGFDPQDVLLAWLFSNQRKPLVLDYLLSLKGGNLSNPQKGEDRLIQTQYFEQEIQKAISLSIEESDKNYKPTELLRMHNSLAGLKNIGNTCYFNSLVQMIFQIEDFVKTILAFCPPYDTDRVLKETNVIDPKIFHRKKESIKLVSELQKLFVQMLYGNKSVLDPSEAMASIVDSQGRRVKVGEQSDISEFAINFFERIEEGLKFDSRPQGDKEAKDEKSGIENLFFGKSKDFITFEWSDFKTKKNQESIFGPINLNISNGDLMSALESYTDFSVDGYQTPNGEVTTARKKVWITTPPKVLTFVLQRVEYDRETKGLLKKNDFFSFPKELFIDRFLYDQKKNLSHILEEKKILKIKEKRIDNEINQLLQYKNTNLPLRDILDATHHFFVKQIEEMEKEFVEINSDSPDDKQDECSKPEELKKFCEILKKYQGNVTKKILKLENEKEYIKKKTENTFHDLQKMKYFLNGIVVHEGGPTSGHYYSFVFDSIQNRWKKFNDSKITEVSEEEVLQISFGGVTEIGSKNNHSCAYCLFYTQQDCKQMDFDLKEIEKFKKILSKEMLTFIENENSKFLVEYQHYNSNITKTIYDEYLKNMKYICSEAVKFQGEFKNNPFPFLPSFPNFGSFLMFEPQKCSEIARWSVLKAILKNNQVPYKILEGERKNFYYYELKELVLDEKCPYKLSNMELSDKNNEFLDNKKKEFIILSKCILIIKWIFKLIMERNWKEAIITISFLHEKIGELKIQKPSKVTQEYLSAFVSFARYLLVIMCFKFCTLIDMNHSKLQNKEALNLLEIMIYSLNKKQTIKLPNIFYQQIVANLDYSMKSLARNDTKESDLVVLFKHHIKKIEEKIEFLPSFDISSLLNAELVASLTGIESIEGLFYVLDQKNVYELQHAYKKVFSERLQIWCDIEEQIRKKSTLFDQEARIEKETITWFEE